jgi:hypothetical protein
MTRPDLQLESLLEEMVLLEVSRLAIEMLLGEIALLEESMFVLLTARTMDSGPAWVHLKSLSFWI